MPYRDPYLGGGFGSGGGGNGVGAGGGSGGIGGVVANPYGGVGPAAGGGARPAISPGMISDLFNNAGGGGGGGSSPGPNFNNTAQSNPDLEYAINGLKGQLSNDTTGHAIDMAGGKLRDLAEGQKSAAAAGRTSRGVSGTGVDDYDNRRIDTGTQRAIAGTATDITLGREAQKDSIYGQIAGAGASQAGINQADRSLALQQWQTDQANQRAREQAQAAQQASILNMILSAA